MAPLVIQFIEQTFRPESELNFGRNAELSLDPDNGVPPPPGRPIPSDRRHLVVGESGQQAAAQNGFVGRFGDRPPTPERRARCWAGAGPYHWWPAPPGTKSATGWKMSSPALLSDTLRAIPVGADTVTYGTKLTPRELDFVVVLAQGRLTGRGGALPSHADIAETWGVSKKTVDNTLQRLRAKLRTKDVRFLDSSEMLVEYLVSQGLVTMADLEWAGLDQPDGPRAAGERPE